MKATTDSSLYGSLAVDPTSVSNHDDQEHGTANHSYLQTPIVELNQLEAGVTKELDTITSQGGSTWVGASFNLTNSIVGAGCIGLGNAIAQSGGLISLVSMLVFAILCKYSFDLVIALGLESTVHEHHNDNNDHRDGESKKETHSPSSSYEGLGYATYGSVGKWTVLISKLLYSVGCLVAYIVIIKDNLSSSLTHLLQFRHAVVDDMEDTTASISTGGGLLWLLSTFVSNPDWMTILCCTTIMLPLCLLRDITPLERYSIVKIVAVLAIVMIVVALYFEKEDQEDTVPHRMADDDDATAVVAVEPHDQFYQHWLAIRPGALESLGTFVFTFASQHTVHLVFQSLRPSSRTAQEFSKSTTLATLLSTVISFGLGLFVYMTFWENTSSSMFVLYPPSSAIDCCRLLLCLSMLLTYPMSFFAVRELVLLVLYQVIENPSDDNNCKDNNATTASEEESEHIPLVATSSSHQHVHVKTNATTAQETTMSSSSCWDSSSLWLVVVAPQQDDDDSNGSHPQQDQKLQLQPRYHFLLTVVLWLATLFLALKATSLGDVLNLTGCATGTMISYILPAIFSYKLHGPTILGSLLLVLGGSIGLVGTIYSILAMTKE